MALAPRRAGRLCYRRSPQDGLIQRRGGVVPDGNDGNSVGLERLFFNTKSFLRTTCVAILPVSAVAMLASSVIARADSPRSDFAGSQYRSIDGRNNNLSHPSWGSAGSRYRREASGAHYGDGLSTPAGASRPSARAISNALSAQGDIETEDERNLSTCNYEFGQFLDHDIGLALGGATESFNISVPSGDPWFDPNNTGSQVIPMKRSGFDRNTGTNNARQQINLVTAYVDASQVYGSDATRAAWLRTNHGGHLKTAAETYGDMLPLNDGTLPNDNPLGLPATSLYVAGDVRANEQPGLTAFHVAFLREHNWQADRLHAAHPNWSDEKLYQEARRWVGAEMQVIVYREFLPSLLGRDLPPYSGYKANVNPGLSNAFATAAYRIGHSMVGPDIELLDDHFQEVGQILLADGFFNPNAIPDAGGVNPIIRYFAAAVEQRIDTQIVDPLRNFLFGPPGAGGLDLGSLNIQRGRDHGLGDYNTVREDFGLPRVASFSQITSNSQVAQKLQELYGSIDDIDPWVGMLAEDHLPHSSVGQTHMAILIDQFVRLRDGDRFWYQRNGFSQQELAMMQSTHLSDILERNTEVTGLQNNMFFAANHPPSGVCHGECTADFDDGSGTGNSDGQVNSADLIYYQQIFLQAMPCADLDDGSGLGMPDGQVTYLDFFFFFKHFQNGC